MGLFSSKKKTYVASSVYNLAGDVEDAVDFLKFTVGSSVLMASNDIAKDMIGSLTTGPAMSQNRFLKWSKREYTVSNVTADITNDSLSNPDLIKPYITKAANQNIWVQSAFVGDADPEYFAEDYLARNYPQLLALDWTYTFNDVTGVVNIDFADDSKNKTFTVTGYDGTKDYIYGRYVLVSPESSAGLAIPYQEKANLISASQLPKTDTYGLDSRTESLNNTVNLKTTTRTIIDYNDSRPRVDTTSVSNATGYYNHIEENYSKSVYRGRYGSSTQTYTEVYRLKTIQHYRIKTRQTRNQVISEDGVVATTTIINEEYVEPIWSYTITKQEILDEVVEGPYMFIYQIGSGIAALDALQTKTTEDQAFYPVLPLRWENKFIDHAELVDGYYEPVRKAYKKATNGAKIDELLDQLKDNENIDDIDYIYMVFGLSLNETDVASGRYIYQFLKDLIPYQQTSKTEFEAYHATQREQDIVGNQWDSWNQFIAQPIASASGSQEPARPQYSAPKRSSLVLNSTGQLFNNFALKMYWYYIDEKIYAGRGKPNAKRGDVWMTTKPLDRELGTGAQDYNNEAFLATASGMGAFFSSLNLGNNTQKVYVYYQYDNNMYRRLECCGLQHSNYVYGGKSVKITGYEAVKDDEPSGFIIPMHYPTMKKLSLVDQNQLATRNKILVMNSYKVVKIKWYQRGIFKVVMAVLLVVGAYLVMGPAGFAATQGLLGTNAAVGAAIGLGQATLAAAFAGAAANAVAAMVLVSLVQKVAVEAFGEKWGAVIAAVATFAIMSGNVSFSGGASVNPINWSNMFKADNLLKLTDPIMQATQGVMRGMQMDISEDYESLTSSYNDSLKEIEQLTRDMLGPNTGLDATLLTDSVQSQLRESRQAFLDRTLMTGSDIAELSTGMIDRFVEATLALEGPFR